MQRSTSQTTIHVRMPKMSMYSELLAASLRAVAGRHPDLDGERLEAMLLEELGERRRLLGPAPASLTGHERRPAGDDVMGDVARQLNYDLVLLELCALRGIECDPARFTRPSVERRRLEVALTAAGLDVAFEP